MKIASGRAIDEQVLVHLVRGETLAPLGRFLFLAHAGPDVGVDRVRAGYGFCRIVGDRRAAHPRAPPALRPATTISGFGS